MRVKWENLAVLAVIAIVWWLCTHAPRISVSKVFWETSDPEKRDALKLAVIGMVLVTLVAIVKVSRKDKGVKAG